MECGELGEIAGREHGRGCVEEDFVPFDGDHPVDLVRQFTDADLDDAGPGLDRQQGIELCENPAEGGVGSALDVLILIAQALGDPFYGPVGA